LKERLLAGVWNTQVLLRELRQRNYGGGYMMLTDWLRHPWWQCGGSRRCPANRRR
jgi:hypothetical protein